MEEKKNRQKVFQEVEKELRRDRSPSKALQVSDFGLVIVTRKRVKQSLERQLTEPCPYCSGSGFIKSSANDLLRDPRGDEEARRRSGRAGNPAARQSRHRAGALRKKRARCCASYSACWETRDYLSRRSPASLKISTSWPFRSQSKQKDGRGKPHVALHLPSALFRLSSVFTSVFRLPSFGVHYPFARCTR